jgi:hypothetical protein
VRNIELFDARHSHLRYAARRLPAATPNRSGGLGQGSRGVKAAGEMHLANVAQGTVNWLHATGFLFRDDPSDQRSESTYRYVLSPRAFEALQLKLPDVLRKNGDKPEASAVRSRNWRL